MDPAGGYRGSSDLSHAHGCPRGTADAPRSVSAYGACSPATSLHRVVAGSHSLRTKPMSIHGCQVAPSSDRSQSAVIDWRSGATLSVDRTRAVCVFVGCAAGAM